MFKRFFELDAYLRPVRGKYESEIDGLRFLAIFPVVLTHYMTSIIRNGNYQEVEASFFFLIIQSGGFGVFLFFLISGFILSKPFFTALESDRELSLWKYFRRRFIRIEPPYLIVILGLFVAQVMIGTISFDTDKLFASLFYAYGFTYGTYSPINPVAWSLEVEIQFYVLMPLLFVLLKRVKKVTNWILGGLILFFILLSEYVNLHALNLHLSLLRYGHFFLIGMLLANMEVKGESRYFQQRLCFINPWLTFVVCLFLIIVCQLNWTNILYQLQILPLFIIFLIVRDNQQATNRFFSIKPIAIIGGMCYTIYLIHYAFLHIITKTLLATYTTEVFYFDLLIYAFSIALVFLIAFPVYRIIERPFMLIGRQGKKTILENQ